MLADSREGEDPYDAEADDLQTDQSVSEMAFGNGRVCTTVIVNCLSTHYQEIFDVFILAPNCMYLDALSHVSLR